MASGGREKSGLLGVGRALWDAAWGQREDIVRNTKGLEGWGGLLGVLHGGSEGEGHSGKQEQRAQKPRGLEGRV